MKHIKAGEVIKLKAEWMDEGDEGVVFVAVEDEVEGRVKVEAQLGMAINPVQVVRVDWLEDPQPFVARSRQDLGRRYGKAITCTLAPGSTGSGS